MCLITAFISYIITLRFIYWLLCRIETVLLHSCLTKLVYLFRLWLLLGTIRLIIVLQKLIQELLLLGYWTRNIKWRWIILLHKWSCALRLIQNIHWLLQILVRSPSRCDIGHSSTASFELPSWTWNLLKIFIKELLWGRLH